MSKLRWGWGVNDKLQEEDQASGSAQKTSTGLRSQCGRVGLWGSTGLLVWGGGAGCCPGILGERKSHPLWVTEHQGEREGALVSFHVYHYPTSHDQRRPGSPFSVKVYAVTGPLGTFLMRPPGFLFPHSPRRRCPRTRKSCAASRGES